MSTESELVERPSFVKEKRLKYLDMLRERGVTNMYGASPFIQRAFRMSREKADKALIYWMRTFTTRRAHGSASGSPEDAE